MKLSRNLIVIAVFSLLFTNISATNAAPVKNKLTFFYEVNLSFVFPESVADTFLEQIESGEQTCKSVMSVAVFKGYADQTYGYAFLLNDKYVAKNESSKTIAAGKFKAIFNKAPGSYICRVSATVTLPKASFYSILDNKGNVLVESFPRSEFKKNSATVDVSEY